MHTNFGLKISDSAHIGIWIRFVLLAGIGIAAMLYSIPAGFIALLGIMLALAVPTAILPLTVALLVWTPMRGIFSAKASELVSTAVMAQNIENGDLPREIAIVSLLAVGLFLLSRARFQVKSVVSLKCFFAYMSLALLSVLWSANPLLTGKRVIAALSCVVFSAGLAVGYYGRNSDGGTRLVRHICLMGSIACAAVIIVAILAGNFHVLDLGWRLGSVGRENQISWVAAIPFLTVWATRDDRKIWPTSSSFMVIIAVTGTVLVLTKSRTTLIATAGGLLVCELLKRWSKRRLVAMALLAAALLVSASTSWFDQFWLRGADENQLQTASGRTILWKVVWRDISERPLLGYGYGGYWTADRVFSQEVEWAPTSAHNGYLDTMAQLGFFGLALIVTFIALCSREGLRLMRLGSMNRRIGMLLLVITVWLVIINFTESYIDSLEYFPMLATLTLSFYVSYLNSATPPVNEWVDGSFQVRFEPS